MVLQSHCYGGGAFLLLLAIGSSHAFLSTTSPSVFSVLSPRPSNFLRQFANEFVDRDFQDYDDDESSVPTFEINQMGGETVGAHFFSRKPLDDVSFCLHPDDLFARLCRGAGISRPSRIQSIAWPVVLQGNHTIIADQTGSGKTLAYMIPLLQRALADLHPNPPKKTNGAPKILVLAPTAELADQVRAVCDRLAQHVSFSTLVITATGKFSTSIRDQIRILQRQPVDVLISTPGRLATIVRTRNSGLDLTTRLQAMVLDEVDILMDDHNQNSDEELGENDTFGPQLRTIGEGVGERLSQTQFVFVTATLPDRIVRTISGEFPGVVQARGPGLHRIVPSLTERLIDVSLPPRDNGNSQMGFALKARQLLSTLRMTRCRRTLIFCNTVQSCRAVENLLARSDRRRRRHQVGAYHNAMTPQARNANLERFTKEEDVREATTTQSKPKSKSANDDHPYSDLDRILVCTDRAGRGVDFGASPVDHVVLFDFPVDPAEYLRRVGRTARAGRAGTCTVLAYGWQLPVARSVMGKTVETLPVRRGGDDRQDDDDDNNNAEIVRGGVPGRKRLEKRQQQKRRNSESNTRDTAIKNKIEGGRLWKE